MAAVESVPVDLAPTTDVTPEKTEKLQKVDKPDEETYKKDLAEAEKALSAINEKMVSLIMSVY
jgi:hypothetical protein